MSLAGPLLILSATMMGSLVISEIIAAVRFTPDPLLLSLVFALIALAATLLTGSYLRVASRVTADDNEAAKAGDCKC